MKAIIIGCDGQDGSYLWEQLVDQGASIVGLTSQGMAKTERGALPERIHVLDAPAIEKLIREFLPDEIHYLAGFHHSSEQAMAQSRTDHLNKSLDAHVLGLANVLRSMAAFAPGAALVYAASSKIFGEPNVDIQTEETPFSPICIYGISKTAGIHLCQFFRREHGLRVSCAILYNHESPRRPERFVSQKIVNGLLKIKHGISSRLELGDVNAAVDWGYAPDYTRAMQLIAEVAPAGEYIVATGKLHTVRQILEIASARLGMNPAAYLVESPGVIHRKSKPLCGDASKIRARTGWKSDVSFERLVEIMVDAARLKYA